LLEPKLLEETDEKLVARLALTYGILRRLGFSEETVANCLKAIPGVDMDDAYEWVILSSLFPADCHSNISARDALP
jgi:ATP-dependent RNA helicase DHX29